MRRTLARTRSKTKTRAIWDDEKAQRESDLVNCAQGLFASNEYADIAILDICKKAGLAKGSFYLYFDSKEEIFLRMAIHQIQSWDVKACSVLRGLSVSVSTKIAAQAYAQSLDSFEMMLRLFAILHSVIEKNVAPAKIAVFKRAMIEIQQRQAAEWMRVYPKLGESRCLELLSFISTAFVGVWTLSNPPASGIKALELIGMKEVIRPFSEIFSAQLKVFLDGLFSAEPHPNL
jgi:AcrR family transcriptional regulator